jgi:hypothetical protein
MKEQFELKILNYFDPMTQELYQYLPATIHKQHKVSHQNESNTLTARKPHATETPDLDGS